MKVVLHKVSIIGELYFPKNVLVYQPLVPVNVAVFLFASLSVHLKPDERVSADVIKMKSYWIKMGPESND